MGKGGGVHHHDYPTRPIHSFHKLHWLIGVTSLPTVMLATGHRERLVFTHNLTAN